MKKFAKILLLFVFSISLLFSANFIFNNAETKTVQASSEEVTYSNYYNSFDLESSLFSVLLTLENEVADENDTGFSSSFFATEFVSASPTSEDGIAIKNDLISNKLNLTLGENSPYECLRTFTEKITDISGLNNLDLSGIHTLVLDDNDISVVSSSDFSSLTDISVISICNNSISSFSINPILSSEITQLYLSDNKLTQVDLSDLAINARIDLAGNFFENLSDITFGGAVTYLDLSFNNITEEPSIPLSLGCTPIFLMQGLNKETFLAGDIIAVANDNVYVQDLIVHVNFFAGNGEITASEYYVNSDDILSSAGTIGFNQIELPAGKLEISFSYVGNVNTPENDEMYFEDMFIASKLPAPNVIATSNGSNITTYVQSTPMNFSFTLNLNPNVINKSQVLLDAVIYSGILGKEQENIATYNITSHSYETLSSYYVFDGIMSEKATISVSYQSSSNSTLALILIIIIFIVLASVVYIIRWIRNGTPITPLSDAEMFREKIRQEKRRGTRNSSYQGNSPNNFGDDVVDLSSKDFSPDDGESVDLIREDDSYNKPEEKGRYRK